MPAKSLAELCYAVCLKNIKDITDVGSTPYNVIRRVLLKIDSANQLLQIEENTPQLRSDDAECWIRLIEREFPALVREHHFEPRNPESWHKVYAKYKKMNDRQKAEAEAKLKNAFAGIQAKKDAKVSDIVNFDRRRLPRPPVDGRRYGPGSKQAGGRRGGSNDTGELKFTTGTRTKVNTAQSIMRKVKREAKEIHVRNKLATPNGALVVKQGQIKKAPIAMVNDERIKSQGATRINPPGMRKTLADKRRDADLEEKQTRSHKSKSTKSTTYISDSDLDDNDEGGWESGGDGRDDEDMGDLFDKPPAHNRLSAYTKFGRTGILANAKRAPPQIHRTSVAPQERPRSQSGVPSSSRPASSPPPRPSSPAKPLPAAGSSQMRAKILRKRKEPDVFMKPKPKIQRR